ncbi:MAG: hypothetical protein EB078_04060 [Proteobacteria bacterium]|nr:hypothetical protein [Pseudomonadota bacterium]NDC24073.1 hypothetical protein [Pseudomonadota bacterium]NDD04058.1 hypothetical protein [Pseudomonadota bacterium]NDG25869.1 hypothetical protein [Pseudomonadota bacterium]
MAGLNWLINGWGTWLAFKQFTSKVRLIPDDDLPSVSILKPLKGVDPGLHENLESCFHVNYPRFEILFSVSSPNDPAALLIQPLLEKYPNVNAKLIISNQEVGPNPKVNNLLASYKLATHDVVLISDSNIRVSPDYLRNLVPDLTPDVGVITAVVAGTHPNGLGGYLEASYLNTFFARWMFLARVFSFESVVGKSMLFKRSTLERFGGLKTLSGYIAEDYMTGHAMKKLDLKVEIMRSPVRQYLGHYSFSSFWKRHIRWGRIRKSIAPLAFIIEPLFFSSVTSLFFALAISQWFGFHFGLAWTIHMTAWWIMDSFLCSLIDQFSWKLILAWWVREVIAIPIWLAILLGNTVDWRGKDYRLLPGGLLEGIAK